jgi:hypothetical protein
MDPLPSDHESRVAHKPFFLCESICLNSFRKGMKKKSWILLGTSFVCRLYKFTCRMHTIAATWSGLPTCLGGVRISGRCLESVFVEYTASKDDGERRSIAKHSHT